MKTIYSHLSTLAAMALMATATASAQDYFFFDDGGSIAPAEGVVAELGTLVIDYAGCQGTQEGLNPSEGLGKGWILGPNGTHDVLYTDDYAAHKLTLSVKDGPIVKAGDYKLTIPESFFNVYNKPNVINDAVSYYYTVDGSKDMGDTPVLHIVNSTPTDGATISLPIEAITLTFDQDITVNHSAFDAAGIVTNLTTGGYIQLGMTAQDNVLTITRGKYSSTDFMAGQDYELRIYAGRVKAKANPDIILGETVITFHVAKDEDQNTLKVIAQIPAAGENIINAGSLTFNRNLTAVDKSKVQLRNERGHVVKLSTVGRDSEAPASLIFNIAESEKLQANTTYKLHLEAGAVTAGTYTNAEMDAAYWCIPVLTFPLTDIKPAGVSVPVFSQMVITADEDGLVQMGSTSDIKVTGVSENQDHIYSTATSCKIDGRTITIDFDPVTPDMLLAGGALYNSVKVVIPNGIFANGTGNVNRAFNSIVYVIEEKEIGPQSWTFNPASGSRLSSLGLMATEEDENGNPVKVYYIELSVSGENVFANIKDGSSIKLQDYDSGVARHIFGKNDVTRMGNRFTLQLGNNPVTEAGHYELVIPASAIDLYYDEGMTSAAQHPLEDVCADWEVGEESGIELLTVSPATTVRTDLMGRRLNQDQRPHLCIEDGKVVMNK